MLTNQCVIAICFYYVHLQLYTFSYWSLSNYIKLHDTESEQGMLMLHVKLVSNDKVEHAVFHCICRNLSPCSICKTYIFCRLSFGRYRGLFFYSECDTYDIDHTPIYSSKILKFLQQVLDGYDVYLNTLST